MLHFSICSFLPFTPVIQSILENWQLAQLLKCVRKRDQSFFSNCFYMLMRIKILNLWTFRLQNLRPKRNSKSKIKKVQIL